MLYINILIRNCVISVTSGPTRSKWMDICVYFSFWLCVLLCFLLVTSIELWPSWSQCDFELEDFNSDLLIRQSRQSGPDPRSDARHADQDTRQRRTARLPGRSRLECFIKLKENIFCFVNALGWGVNSYRAGVERHDRRIGSWGSMLWSLFSAIFTNFLIKNKRLFWNIFAELFLHKLIF
jgi:hypothetical protein